ncbi:MAG: helix-hairpin-helix domain-containing protein [Chitinophagaceae bacterium]|nr:helix-hairpin-helix domain-containing protein [Chitinophagaceae bacterium]
MKKWLPLWFEFSNSQRMALLVLIALIVGTWGVYFMLPQWITRKPVKASAKYQALIAALDRGKFKSFRTTEIDTHSIRPFLFNPNTLDSSGFVKLGLRPKLIHTILNYRSKGGHFYRKEGFQKIYGLRPEEYDTLEPYIQIPEISYERNGGGFQTNGSPVELNTADTNALIKLNGIGSKLAQNIIQYRELLGGYVRLEQLKEVYGIREETFQKIKPFIHVNSKGVKKINLNVATLAELNAHPYLRGEVANAIAAYRKGHNYKIEKLDDLKEIPLINEELFRKIANYLTLQ